MALAVREAGWEVWIAADPNSDHQRILDYGMQFIPLRTKSGIGSIAGEVVSAWGLYRAMRQVRPAVVHLIYLKVVIIGGLLAKFAGVPAVVGAVTGLGTLFAESRMSYKVMRSLVAPTVRLGFRNRNAVLAFENDDDRSLFVERGAIQREQTVVIPGAGVGLEEIAATDLPDGIPVIILIARMIRSKGVGELIEACRLLREKGLRFELLLAGGVDQGNPTSFTAEELRKVETEGIARWLGHRTDIPLLLQQASIVCLPTSYREGLPRVLIEAGAAGRPSVTCDVPGCREIIKHGVNGLIVPPKDVAALGTALEYLIKNPAICESMGRAARDNFIQSYTLSSVFESLDRCYRLLGISLTVAKAR